MFEDGRTTDLILGRILNIDRALLAFCVISIVFGILEVSQNCLIN